MIVGIFLFGGVAVAGPVILPVANSTYTLYNSESVVIPWMDIGYVQIGGGTLLFDISGLAGSTIADATLNFYVRDTVNSPFPSQMDIRDINTPIGTLLTDYYSNEPPVNQIWNDIYSGTLYASVSIQSGAQQYSVALYPSAIADLQSAIAGGSQYFIVGLSSDVSSAAWWEIHTAVGTNNLTVTTAVPEPTTMLLFGTGLLGLWGARRKFKK